MSERDVLLAAAEPVKVQIFNQTYSLRARDGGEHALRVARAVDERMRHIATQLSVCDVTKIAVLTAMHFADELQGVRDYYERELDALRAPQAAEAEGETEETSAAAPEAQPAHDAPTEDPAADLPAARSWFEAIFDDEAFDRPVAGGRMSEQIPSRLKRPRPAARPEPANTNDPAAELADPFEP